MNISKIDFFNKQINKLDILKMGIHQFNETQTQANIKENIKEKEIKLENFTKIKIGFKIN